MLELAVAFLSKVGLSGLASIVKVWLDAKTTKKTELEIHELEAKEQMRASTIQHATFEDIQRYDPKYRSLVAAAKDALTKSGDRAKDATSSAVRRLPLWAALPLCGIGLALWGYVLYRLGRIVAAWITLPIE